MASTTKNSKVWIVLFALTFVALTWALYDRYLQMQELSEVRAQFELASSEKTEVTGELNDLLENYESLKTNNDSINAQLQAEQDRIEKLLKEIKNVKYSNALKIQQYKKEVTTLRTIMKGYIVQIDSLNTLNQDLMAENSEVKKDYRTERNLNQELTSLTDSLTGTVEEASVLSLKNSIAFGINSRGKEVVKSKKTEKIKVCFSLSENTIAPKGNRTVYIRIAGPDTEVLRFADTDLFGYQGKEIVYSAKKTINYTGKETDACLFFTPHNLLPPGSYVVDVFSLGNKIGQVSFNLK